MVIKEMPKLFSKSFEKIISLIICISIFLGFFNSPSYAAKTSMTGDYAKDTISVVKPYKLLLILQKILLIMKT